MLPDSGQTFSSFLEIFKLKTKYQEVTVIDTNEFGRVLMLDGVPQSSELDEFIYHEILVHLGLGLHPLPKNILIIGGGEGAVIREVLKYQSVEHITMVDIDGDLIEVAKQYLGHWHQESFSSSLLNLVIQDGRQFVAETNDKFDCVIIDLSDPNEGNPSQDLFSKEFYELVLNVLHPSGIVTLQAGNATFKKHNEHCRTLNTLQSVFPSVISAYAYIPLYASLYAFSVCGKFQTANIIDTVEKNIAKNAINLDFINKKTIQMICSTPSYISNQMLTGNTEIITDKERIKPFVWKLDQQ